MSETETNFKIEVNDDVTLRRDSMLEHAEHGPMRVKSIRVGPHRKKAELQSEMGPVGLELTGEEVRERWGETLAQDPFELHDPGSVRINATGISPEGCDVEVDLTVNGPERNAELVSTYAVEHVVRALQAVRDGQPPSECDGSGRSIDWEVALGEEA